MKQKPYKQPIQALAKKWLNGTITPEEEKEFAEWYNRFNDEAELSLDETFATDEASLKERIFVSLKEKLNEDADVVTHANPLPHRVHFLKHRWPRLTAAAVIGGALIIGVYLFVSNSNTATPIAKTTLSPKVKDLSPGGNKATLVLADGSAIVLDSAANGKLAEQGNMKVTKLADGRIAYSPTNAPAGKVGYNEVKTPRGGQYQVTLPDGTKVWLNSASSIRYPASFTNKERNVEIVGEAYFEVAHVVSRIDGKLVPFKVKANNVSVEVLGTHFNINAYNDEASIRTTLLQGSVKVEQLITHNSQVIIPGQQAQLSGNNPSSPIQVTNNVDLDQVMAWKSGFFEFDNADPATIMRQIGRWYDVDIVFEGTPPEQLGGRIGKDLPLSKLLKILEATGVKCRLEGRKLIVAAS